MMFLTRGFLLVFLVLLHASFAAAQPTIGSVWSASGTGIHVNLRSAVDIDGMSVKLLIPKLSALSSTSRFHIVDGIVVKRLFFANEKRTHYNDNLAWARLVVTSNNRNGISRTVRFVPVHVG